MALITTVCRDSRRIQPAGPVYWSSKPYKCMIDVQGDGPTIHVHIPLYVSTTNKLVQPAHAEARIFHRCGRAWPGGLLVCEARQVLTSVTSQFALSSKPTPTASPYQGDGGGNSGQCLCKLLVVSNLSKQVTPNRNYYTPDPACSHIWTIRIYRLLRDRSFSG